MRQHLIRATEQYSLHRMLDGILGGFAVFQIDKQVCCVWLT